MIRKAILAIFFSSALLAGAQSDSMLHINQFPGTTVADKVSAAMPHCPAAPVPCILVIDASLAAAAPGSMPAMCSNCHVIDYRSGQPQTQSSQTFNVLANGAAGDCVKNDTAAIRSAIQALNASTAQTAILFFPPGCYGVDAASMISLGGNSGYVFGITRNNVIVEGPGATMRLLASTAPYSQLYNVPSGVIYNGNYFYFAGSSGFTMEGFTIDSNNQTSVSATCVGAFGCFWMSGVQFTGTMTGATFTGNSFLNIDGWPWAANVLNNLVATRNYASRSKGMLCWAGSGCQITDNVSENSSDAPYGANGTAGVLASDFLIANNRSNGTWSGDQNGGGIDITAAQNGVVSGNVIIDAWNYCINVSQTGGMYPPIPNSYLGSDHITVSKNLCQNDTHNDVAGIAPIYIGELYSQTQGGSTFQSGYVASNVIVQGNTIISNDQYGSGVGVGYGALNVKVEGNLITGCASVCATSPSVPYAQILEAQPATATQTQGVQISNNTIQSGLPYPSNIQLSSNINDNAVFGNKGFSAVTGSNAGGVALDVETGLISSAGNGNPLCTVTNGGANSTTYYLECANAPGVAGTSIFSLSGPALANLSGIDLKADNTNASGNITAAGNITAGSGASTVFRCATAGTLPAGALTITAANCGTTADTGLRVK